MAACLHESYCTSHVTLPCVAMYPNKMTPNKMIPVYASELPFKRLLDSCLEGIGRVAQRHTQE